MRRYAAALILVLAGFLLTSGAAAGASPPSITPTFFGTSGTNNWFTSDVTVNWSIQSTLPYTSIGCDGVKLTAETTGTNVTCSASNDDGTTSMTVTVKIDKTPPTSTAAPSRPADSNGWYNHTLGISCSGTDATSGISACTQAGYSGPDDGSASVAGTCVDVAGNVSASTTFGLQYDAAGPSVTATPARGADANGWYNHSLSVSYSGTDATSGGVSCVSARTYSGPDDATASVTGSCTDKAGNTTSRTFGLKYDGSAPSVSATAARTPDSNGWYNRALNVSFAGAAR